MLACYSGDIDAYMFAVAIKRQSMIDILDTMESTWTLSITYLQGTNQEKRSLHALQMSQANFRIVYCPDM